MQHFQMAGFSEEVPRLATTPRGHSTNCHYDDRWFRFPGLAAELGIVWLGPRVAQEASSVFPLRDPWILTSDVQGQQILNGFSSQPHTQSREVAR